MLTSFRNGSVYAVAHLSLLLNMDSEASFLHFRELACAVTRRQNDTARFVSYRMKRKSDFSDSELLRSMLAGDEEALALLYRRRQAGIYRFALQMCGLHSIAEDVTQEVFIFLMREGNA